jgi:hypothetical protein
MPPIPCDHEMQDVAKLLGRYWYGPEVIIEHRHPCFTGEEQDALLRHTESF